MTPIIPQIKIAVTFDKNVKNSQLFKIGSSLDASEIIRKTFNADTFLWQEEAILLCVNNANKILGFYKISAGGITGTLIDVRMILTTALNCCAVGIIMAHNHPSGTLTPSEADKAITRKVKQACEMMDIKLLDHLIITDESYFSFADDGIL